MADLPKLNRPRLIAVWPGMGQVAFNAGVYLLSKLNMTLLAEFAAEDAFDIEHVDVKEGVLQLGRRPRSRFFVWRDPEERHDLVVFLGEAQPPSGKFAFCKKLIDYARELGVERVYTFAAMATQMHPEHASRVFAAATDQATLDELADLGLEFLEGGHIGGLNGVLLGVAKEEGLTGACLLGEMPHIFSQLPFPKASLAILKLFATFAGLEVDFSELAERAEAMERQLGELLAEVEQAYGAQYPTETEEYKAEPAAEEQIDPEDKRRLEELFTLAAEDRAKAFELKQELDRLGMFAEYEDRFLDLFKKPD